MPHPVKRWKRNEGSEKGLDSINRKKFRESQRKLFHQHAENLSPMREGYVQREESEENEWPGRACFIKDLKNHPWRCQFKKKKKKKEKEEVSTQETQTSCRRDDAKGPSRGHCDSNIKSCCLEN